MTVIEVAAIRWAIDIISNSLDTVASKIEQQ